MQEYLLASLISLEAKKDVTEKQIAKIIGDIDGKILNAESKTQELAYSIKKQNEVVLSKIFLSLEPSRVLDLEKELHHESGIVRFLLVKFPYTKVKQVKENDIEKIASKAKGAKTPKIAKTKVVKKVVKKVIKTSKNQAELDKALEKILKE